jgi:hypothetical protein
MTMLRIKSSSLDILQLLYSGDGLCPLVMPVSRRDVWSQEMMGSPPSVRKPTAISSSQHSRAPLLLAGCEEVTTDPCGASQVYRHCHDDVFESTIIRHVSSFMEPQLRGPLRCISWRQQVSSTPHRAHNLVRSTWRIHSLSLEVAVKIRQADLVYRLETVLSVDR